MDLALGCWGFSGHHERGLSLIMKSNTGKKGETWRNRYYMTPQATPPSFRGGWVDFCLFCITALTNYIL